jgi:hypothetical protein
MPPFPIQCVQEMGGGEVGGNMHELCGYMQSIHTVYITKGGTHSPPPDLHVSTNNLHELLHTPLKTSPFLASPPPLQTYNCAKHLVEMDKKTNNINQNPSSFVLFIALTFLSGNFAKKRLNNRHLLLKPFFFAANLLVDFLKAIHLGCMLVNRS